MKPSADDAVPAAVAPIMAPGPAPTPEMLAPIVAPTAAPAAAPAASLIHYFRGNTIVLINKSPTSADSLAQLVISEGIGQILGQIQVR